MAKPIAVLWMITALGFPDQDASGQFQAAAVAVPPGATDVPLARVLGSDTLAQRNAGPEAPAARPPVPFLRQSSSPAPSPASSSAPSEVPEAATEEESHNALERDAAKAAIERDGYKRVMMLGKASNGAWRAKAYRGRAEVALTVGSNGTVSAE